MRKQLLSCLVLGMAAISAMAQEIPVADMLDVQFNLDGTAVDLSPMKNTVEYVGEGVNISYNSIFEGNVATFNTEWSKKPGGYYMINFEDNQTFRDKLADGHSLEMLVKAGYEGKIQDVEAKPFSAMQAGGTGFLICTTSASGSGGKNGFTFLPNISTTGGSTWRWTTSRVTPLSGFYYHVVGVWNKEEEKAYIYVNGQLCNTVDAPGEFHDANAGCRWFCIGGDASGSGAEAGWTGDIFIARVYDNPLSGEDVALLWNAVEKKEKEANSAVYQEVVQEGLIHLEGLIASQSIITEYEEALHTLEDLIQNGTVADLEAQYENIGSIRATLDASAVAYQGYKEHAEAAIATLEENTGFAGDDRDYIESYLYEYFEPNDEYPNGSYSYIWETHQLSSEKIAVEASWVDEKLRVAIENGYVPGSDITQMLTNASFADGFAGWKGTVGSGTAKSPTNDLYGAECSAKGFDMYQTITGLENGVYVLTASATYCPFSSTMSNYYSAGMYANENRLFFPTIYETRLPVAEAEDGVNCYLTQNGSDAAVDVEIYDEESGEVTAYAIHGKTGIANAASAGRAMNYLVALVTDGTLTIRFNDPNPNAAKDWTGIANVHLLYAGALDDASHYLDETLACMVARANTIINNVPSTDNNYVTNPNIPQDIKDRLQTAVNAVATASTAEEKYTLIGTFSELWSEVEAGRDAYVNMIDEAEACALAAGELVAAEKISQEEGDKVFALTESLWTVFKNGSYTTEEAKELKIFKDANLIPATDENGTYLIKSNYDMVYFAERAEKAGAAQQAVNAKLFVDIDYFTENQMIENFYGEIDGNYHTITVNINRAARGAALINNMQNGSCVKNLTIKGEVSNSDKFVTAVAANTYGTTTISSIVSLINGHSTCVGDSGNGGVMSCSRGATVVKDCVFAGTMEGDAAINSSGIVGWTSGFTDIQNCLQNGDITLNPEGSRTIARIPELVNISNCYYKTAFGAEESTQITDEQLASGEVCYLLNRGNTENPTWFQTLGEDPFPVPNPNHKPVGKKADGTFSNDPSEWETIEPGPVETTPKADLLDVVFNEDGTAEDVSPRHNTITRVGETSSVYYDETYQRYVAHFENPWGGTCSGFYQAESYEDSEISSLLADGHSLEVLCMANYEGDIPNSEAKPFSAMQGGGTGFLISTISGTRANVLTFLPNVTTSGANTWCWVTSGVIPESEVFYHVVGVYNKEEQKTYIYVNGELKNTVDAPGIFRFASTGCNWFAIGGDPSSATAAHGSWRGDVAIARAYDKPLTAEDVAYLWEKVQNPYGIGVLKPAPEAPIGIFRLDGVRVDKAQHGIYIINGKKTLVK